MRISVAAIVPALLLASCTGPAADDTDCPAIFRQLGLNPGTTLPPALRIEPKG